jgi:hypothetical protein
MLFWFAILDKPIVLYKSIVLNKLVVGHVGVKELTTKFYVSPLSSSQPHAEFGTTQYFHTVKKYSERVEKTTHWQSLD